MSEFIFSLRYKLNFELDYMPAYKCDVCKTNHGLVFFEIGYDTLNGSVLLCDECQKNWDKVEAWYLVQMI